jgi:hypothetical protein
MWVMGFLCCIKGILLLLLLLLVSLGNISAARGLFVHCTEGTWCVYGHFRQHFLLSFRRAYMTLFTFFSLTYSGYVVMLEWVCSTLYLFFFSSSIPFFVASTDIHIYDTFERGVFPLYKTVLRWVVKTKRRWISLHT